MARTQLDRSTLEAALIGLQLQLEQIDKKMSELHRQLGGSSSNQKIVKRPSRERRAMSAAARKRIAAAQKKRWAEYRKQRKAA